VAAPVTLRLMVMALTLGAAAVLLGLGDGSRREPAKLVATAAGDVRLQSSRDGAAVLTAESLAPGDSVTGSVRLTNASADPLALSFRMTGLTDEPGDGGGVLSEHLTLRVDRMAGGTAQPVWTGTLADLPDLDLGSLAAGAAGEFRLTATLPELGPAVDDRFARASLEVGYRWTGLSDLEPPKQELPKIEPARPAEPAPPDEIEAGPSPAPWLAAPGPDSDQGRAAGAAAVRLWLGGSSTQRLGSGLSLAAACRPGCTLAARAEVRVGRRWRSVARRALGALGETSQPARLRFALSAPQRRALGAALGGRRSVTVRVRVTAATPGHDSVTKVRSLRLRP
jgi:hypothetical protein